MRYWIDDLLDFIRVTVVVTVLLNFIIWTGYLAFLVSGYDGTNARTAAAFSVASLGVSVLVACTEIWG